MRWIPRDIAILLHSLGTFSLFLIEYDTVMWAVMVFFLLLYMDYISSFFVILLFGTLHELGR